MEDCNGKHNWVLIDEKYMLGQKFCYWECVNCSAKTQTVCK